MPIQFPKHIKTGSFKDFICRAVKSVEIDPAATTTTMATSPKTLNPLGTGAISCKAAAEVETFALGFY